MNSNKNSVLDVDKNSSVNLNNRSKNWCTNQFANPHFFILLMRFKTEKLQNFMQCCIANKLLF